jgi:hypothetical protein
MHRLPSGASQTPRTRVGHEWSERLFGLVAATKEADA